jgi:hypothetical protein
MMISLPVLEASRGFSTRKSVILETWRSPSFSREHSTKTRNSFVDVTSFLETCPSSLSEQTTSIFLWDAPT